MAVLEFLATTAWTWVVASGELVLNERSAWLLGTSVVCGSCCLIGILKLLLVKVALGLGVLRLLLAWHLLRSFLWSLLHFWNAAAHENADDTVVHVVDHVVEQLNALEFEDEQRVFLLV